MVQAKQAALVTRFALPSGRLAAIASAEILFAPSNWLSRWLRVGRAPTSLMTFINTWVPYLGRPWPVTALSANTFLPLATAAMNALASRTLTPRVPRSATALRFFEPITAPTPLRPAARCMSLTTQAKRTPFSPATPIEATRIRGSWCLALIPSSVSQTDLPQNGAASMSLASPLLR